MLSSDAARRIHWLMSVTLGAVLDTSAKMNIKILIETTISKLTALILLFFAALAMAGTFGALHDQISYTISSEYFTKNKFYQFSIPASTPNRLGAAIVGFEASWWMGIPIGIVLGAVGLFHRDFRTMVRETLVSYIVVALIALLVGIGGLLYGVLSTNGADLSAFEFYISRNVENKRAFIRTLYMHEASYFGGVVGLMAGLVWQMARIMVLRIRYRERLPLKSVV